ncbi:hypothetical protein GCM10017044_02180 [Kordiimonas sediminis]|uniref:Copper chaperone PCu(A)C n=1 Tax=Kordiimonas sediminis TaxID=1735581 RepID=A0A919AKG5_9PROT|nr:copper chaperone PCu(A)C [Kordiimonas sediminis]GHF11886.1 hypothetical protein GCM10017044_02180 [Kordiimonas sediminis]
MQMFLKTALAALMMLSGLCTVSAHESEDHNAALDITQAWARTTGNRTVSGAAYFNLRNTGKEAVVITGVKSDVAAMTMIHKSYEDENGVMKMDHQETVSVAPGETLEFKPGGFHIMMMRLHAPFKEGDVFTVTLTFEHRADITLPVIVTGMAGLTD